MPINLLAATTTATMSSNPGMRKRALSSINELAQSVKKPFQLLPEQSQGSTSATGQTSTELITTTNPAGIETIPADASNEHHQEQPTPGKKTGRVRKAVLTGLEAALRGLKLGSNSCPPLQSTAEGMLSCLDAFQALADDSLECNELASRLANIVEDINNHLSSSPLLQISECVTSVASGLEREVKYLSEKKERNRLSRVAGAAKDLDDLVECYRRIELHFQRLQNNAALSTWSLTNEHLVNTRLEGMQPAKQARFDSAMASVVRRRECTPNTRLEVLAGLQNWNDDKDAAKVYWMNGMAGTGKTTIAYSFCIQLKAAHQLVASFFCSQELPECRDATRIIPTIAYQLARFSYPFRHSLCQVLANDPDIIASGVTSQFEKLLVEPLLKIKGTLPDRSLVIVIDALDECVDRINVRSLFGVLFRYATGLPAKFFIACRPELGLYDTMRALSRSVLHLHDIDRSIVQRDIETYLTAELVQASADQIRQLSILSGNLFIFSATVVRYVSPDDAAVDFSERLETILGTTCSRGSKAYIPLDALYGAVLRTATENDKLESIEADAIKRVLHTVICAREPMVLPALAGLLNTTVKKVELALKPLRSVLHVSEGSGLVSTLHASFLDYMFSHSRSGEFFCNSEVHHRVMARCCFDTMKRLLRFNICNLESSYTLDADVADLSKRITNNITLELLYASKYWMDHICEAKIMENDLILSLQQFLEHRALFWLEVLNLTRCISMKLAGFSKLRKWLQVHGPPSCIHEMIHDLQSFATTVAINPISSSTPHLYISVLAFWDQKKPIWKHYGKATQGLMRRKETATDSRTPTALAVLPLRVFGSFAISPDGSSVVSYDENRRLVVLDVYTGQLVLSLQAQSTITWLSAATYSPDGHMIACHYWDDDDIIGIFKSHTGELIKSIPVPHSCRNKTTASLRISHDGICVAHFGIDDEIQIWDVRTEAKLPGLYSESRDFISCIAFSSDGKKIAAGIWSGFIFIWDIHAGNTPVRSTARHEDRVAAVAYSPDGLCVASRSSDGIHIWKAQTADLVRSIDSQYVHSAALDFSPDSKYIASALGEHTVCVWDVHTGHMHIGPLRGHTNIIKSVMFTQDGSRLISVSDDMTVRVWDVQSAYSTGAASTRQTDPIISASISPDNMRFAVTTCGDHVIYIWDKQSENILIGSLKGHTASVNSMAFSRDGQLLASGSSDKTVRLWDVKNERPLSIPYIGHTEVVCQVAFSPNGKQVASISNDSTLHLWDLETGAITMGSATVYPFISSMYTLPRTTWLTFSHDGRHVASGSSTCNTNVWNTYTGDVIYCIKCPRYRIKTLVFSDDDRHIASLSQNGTITHHTYYGKAILTRPPPKPLADFVSCSRNSRYLAHVSGIHANIIVVYDMETGHTLAGPFKTHTSGVSSITVSPDGTWFVSGDNEGQVFIWNLGQIGLDHNNSTRAWSIEKDGWIVGPNQERLLWVMPDSLKSWLSAPHPVVMHDHGPLGFNFDTAAVGPRWGELKWDTRE